MIVAYHSSSEPRLEARRFLHVGTIEQARMRGGRHLHELAISIPSRMPRLRDHGSWNIRSLMRNARRAGLAVYLNRHEGIPLEEFEKARQIADLDRVTDSRFRQLVPSARDSWIVLDPDMVTEIRRIT